MAFSRAASFFRKIGYSGPFILSIDATALVPTITVKGNKLIGIASQEEPVVNSAKDILEFIEDEKLEKAKQANLFLLSPTQEKVPPFILRISPVLKGENWKTVIEWQELTRTTGKQFGLDIISLGADGDSRLRKSYRETYLKDKNDIRKCIAIPHRTFTYCSVLDSVGGEKPQLMFPVWKHLFKKWRNQPLNVKRMLIIGNYFPQIEYLMLFYEKYKLLSGL